MTAIGLWILENIGTVIFGGISVFVSLWAKKIWDDKENYKKEIQEKHNDIIAGTVRAEMKLSLQPIVEDIAQIRREMSDIKTKVNNLETEIAKVADKEKADMEYLLECEKTIICKWCEEYIARGSITNDERRILNHLYNNYEKQGGNGEAKTDYEQAMDLKI